MLDHTADPFPSPWDPSFLLYLKYSDIQVKQEWIPELKDIPAARQRLNELVNTKQGNWDFHNWAKWIAEKLQEKGFRLGISYCIPGSSVPKILGREGLERITENIERETGRSLPDLYETISKREFKANDVDFRLEITDGVFEEASGEIAGVVNQLADHKVTVIGNIAVLVTFGNWDLFIRIQNGRNYIFDAEGAYIRIPFDKRSPPILQVIHPTAFYQSLMFDVAEMSNGDDLNPHVLRAFLYRSICGKRVHRFEVMQSIFSSAKKITGATLAHHLELSFNKHAMPLGSDARHLFLIQLLCERTKQPDWQESCFSQHRLTQATIWSRILSLKNDACIRSMLLWIGAIALSERWKSPFKAWLTERGGVEAIRLQVGDKSLWISIDDQTPHSLNVGVEKAFWDLLQVIPWNKVEKDEPSFVYNQELLPMLCKILPKLNEDTPLTRFLSIRMDGSSKNGLDWEALAKSEQEWESELVFQCIRLPDCEDLILNALPHVNAYALRQALLWKLNLKSSIAPGWFAPFIWDRLIQYSDRNIIYRLLMRVGRSGWKTLDSSLRHRVLSYLAGGKLSITEEVKVLKLTEAPLSFWEKLLINGDVKEHAPLLLRCSAHMIPQLAKKLHPLALSCLQQKQAPHEAVLLLDHWIDANEVTKALELWGCCEKMGLLKEWKRDWQLLAMCAGRGGHLLQLLAAKCAALPCPDLLTWVKQAPLIIPNIQNHHTSLSLLRASEPSKHPELLLLFLGLSPPLDEAWAMVAEQGQGPSCRARYNAIAPAMLEGEDPIWLRRLWHCFFDGWPKGGSKCPWIQKLVDKTLRESIEGEIAASLKNAFMQKTEGVASSIPLLLKLSASLTEKEGVGQLLNLWFELIKDPRFHFNPVTIQENKILKPLLLDELRDHLDVILELIYLKKSSFEDPLALISDLIIDNKNGLHIHHLDISFWIPSLSDWFRKMDPDVCLKGTCKLMQASITASSVELETILDIEVMKLFAKLNDKVSIKGCHALLNAIQEVMAPGCNQKRVEVYLSLIFKLVPKKMSFNDIAAANLILKAAQTCHLLTLLHVGDTRSGLRDIRIFGALAYLRLRTQYVNVVAGWIEQLEGPRKKAYDPLVQAYILLCSSDNKCPITDFSQLLRCIADAALWASQVTDTNSEAASWFQFWLQETGNFICNNVKNLDGIKPFFHAFGTFCFKAAPQVIDLDDSICFNMVRAWARQHTDIKTLFAPMIWKRLQIIRNERYSLIFLSNLRLHLHKNPLINEMEKELGAAANMNLQVYHVSIRQTREERMEEINSGWVMRGIDVARRVALVGVGTLATQPVAIGIRYVTGRSLPVVSYLEQNGYRTGMMIVGIGMSGVVLIGMAMMVTFVFEIVFKRSKD